MTNREWMESLSDEQLAQFLTLGIQNDLFTISIHQLISSFTQSTIGLKDWFAKENFYNTKYNIKGEKLK